MCTRLTQWACWTRNHWRLRMLLTSAGLHRTHCYPFLFQKEVVVTNLRGWVSYLAFQCFDFYVCLDWHCDDRQTPTWQGCLIVWVKCICEIVWCNNQVIPFQMSWIQVSLVSIPSREELRQKNLFSVSDCKMYWQSNGDYLAVKVSWLLFYGLILRIANSMCW